MRHAAIASSAVPTSLVSAPIPLPIMVGLFCVLWSSAFSVAKLALADCPPLLLLAVRFLTAGVLMMATAGVQRMPWTLRRRDVVVFALLGIANQAAYLGLSYIGLRGISSGLSALIISANPVVTAVLAVLLLGERMTWGKSLGLLLGVGGVGFILASRVSADMGQLSGILFTLAALLSLVVGTILFKRFAPTEGLWIGNSVQSLAAGFALLPFALTFESVGDVVPSWRLLAAFAFLVLGISVFAYLLWFRILAVSGATAASSYYFLMPPLGMLFGWLALGEHVAAADLVGIVPVALGIYLVTRPVPAA